MNSFFSCRWDGKKCKSVGKGSVITTGLIKYYFSPQILPLHLWWKFQQMFKLHAVEGNNNPNRVHSDSSDKITG